jgi:TP901-1 family phage major tail protein
MANNRGSAFLLKLGDDRDSYATVAGLKTTQLAINGDAIAVNDNKRLKWRELLSGAGVRSVSVAASGIFVGNAAETALKNKALGGEIAPYELSFESGEILQGRFLVTRLEYQGDFNGERTYALALESSGEVTAR